MTRQGTDPQDAITLALEVGLQGWTVETCERIPAATRSENLAEFIRRCALVAAKTDLVRAADSIATPA